jgi:hypothetical protein
MAATVPLARVPANPHAKARIAPRDVITVHQVTTANGMTSQQQSRASRPAVEPWRGDDDARAGEAEHEQRRVGRQGDDTEAAADRG